MPNIPTRPRFKLNFFGHLSRASSVRFLGDRSLGEVKTIFLSWFPLASKYCQGIHGIYNHHMYTTRVPLDIVV